ncbi:MAG: hypothetical protein WCL27_19260 [Betaproteobacteria bacterium]
MIPCVNSDICYIRYIPFILFCSGEHDMSDNTSETPNPSASKPAAKKAASVAKPEASVTAGVKVQAAKKPARTSAPTKTTKTIAKPETPVATKTPAKAKPAKKDKASKVKTVPTKKPKLVRDSFTFPESDYAMIGALKQRALKAGCEIKKSEVLRAGLAALSNLSDAALLKALAGIAKLKTGRPAK